MINEGIAIVPRCWGRTEIALEMSGRSVDYILYEFPERHLAVAPFVDKPVAEDIRPVAAHIAPDIAAASFPAVILF